MMWTQRIQHLKDNHKFNPSKILDIGACIGHFHDLAKSVWPESDIVMVEANKDCEQKLAEKKSKYYIKALSNKPRQKRAFYRNLQNKINSGESFYREKTAYYSDSSVLVEEVETYTLDELFIDDVFELIKLDTQGSEIDILKGGSKLISRSSYILIEASITNYNIGAPVLKDVLVELSEMNFDMVDIWNCAYANRVEGKHYDDLCQIDVLFQRRIDPIQRQV